MTSPTADSVVPVTLTIVRDHLQTLRLTNHAGHDVFSIHRATTRNSDAAVIFTSTPHLLDHSQRLVDEHDGFRENQFAATRKCVNHYARWFAAEFDIDVAVFLADPTNALAG